MSNATLKGPRFRRRYILLLPFCIMAAASPHMGAARPPDSESHSVHQQALLPPASREHPFVDRTTVPIAKLPLAIDGARTPELISDRLAYRHFIAATAVGDQMDQKDIVRRDFFLRSAGLNSAERATFNRALQPLVDELFQFSRVNGTAPLGAITKLPTSARSLLLDEAYARVRESLTPDAMARLDAHIREHVKTRIRVFGELPPSEE